MANEIKSVMIGLFVIAACGLIIFILMFLHPSVGDNSKILRVRFPDIDKINVGTRVTFAGKPIGEVSEIREIQGAHTTRIGYKGDVYVYELILKVDSGTHLFNTDEISLRTSGLLGEKNVAINPRPAPPGEKIYRVDDQVIYASQVGSVEDTIKDFSALSQKFEKALDVIISTFDEFKQEKILARIGETAKNLSEITGALNKPEEWTDTLANIHHFSERIHISMDTVDKSLDQFYASSINFNEMSKKGKDFATTGNELISYVKKGEGTLGHLVVGDDLYLRLASFLDKGKLAMEDINQYGVLFHQNKKWQRVQAKRLNLMNKLATPQQFSNYFNAELNQISDSLGRVSNILNETDYQCYPQSLILNPEFVNKFSELLKKFDKMQEALQMYNIQVTDSEHCSEY